jgi:hypothetical protein
MDTCRLCNNQTPGGTICENCAASFAESEKEEEDAMTFVDKINALEERIRALELVIVPWLGAEKPALPVEEVQLDPKVVFMEELGKHHAEETLKAMEEADRVHSLERDPTRPCFFRSPLYLKPEEVEGMDRQQVREMIRAKCQALGDAALAAWDERDA